MFLSTHIIFFLFLFSHTVYNYPISTSANKMNSFELCHDNSSFASQHPTHRRSCICFFAVLFLAEQNVQFILIVENKKNLRFFSHVTNVTGTWLGVAFIVLEQDIEKYSNTICESCATFPSGFSLYIKTN